MTARLAALVLVIAYLALGVWVEVEQHNGKPHSPAMHALAGLFSEAAR